MVRLPIILKRVLDRRGLRFLLVHSVNNWAKVRNRDLKRVFYDEGDWIHVTSCGTYVFHEPLFRFDMSRIEQLARFHFLWGYSPKKNDVVMDIGAGVGEEALMFSRDVGEGGKVICVEAHPHTCRRLEKLVKYNRLENVTVIHSAVTEPSRRSVTIGDSDNYLSNHVFASAGLAVPATTVDAIRKRCGLRRVNFLKMNIEGAERLAMLGMTETLRLTEVLCVSCHDFLSKDYDDDFFKTKNTVVEFVQQHGLEVVSRTEQDLPRGLSDQVWAYNKSLISEEGRFSPGSGCTDRARKEKLVQKYED